MTTSNAVDSPVVAVVSSPSTNIELTLDIVDDHSASNLIGALVGFRWDQSNSLDSDQIIPTRVLGQITSIQMRNRWHEDQAFKNIIKSNKKLPAITPQQDTRTAVMKIGGCFVETENPGFHSHGDLGGVPSTGTDVRLVDQRFLDIALRSCEDDLFYLGKAYGSDIKFPMWFKHFGSGTHGVGEAYHIGVFGKTGSGKTGLVKMLLAAYARHPDMGILVIDPQGEFSLEMQGTQVGGQNLNLADMLRKHLQRNVTQLPISNIQLDDFGLFQELLGQSGFYERTLGIRSPEPRAAAESIIGAYIKDRLKLPQLSNRNAARSLLLELKSKSGRVYRSPSYAARFTREVDELLNDGFESFFRDQWLPIGTLFSAGPNKTKVTDLIHNLVHGQNGSKPIFVLDLSMQTGFAPWADILQKRVIAHISQSLISESSLTLSDRSLSANALVILDEAHRFVPSGGLWNLNPQERELMNELKRAVRETRKYGVGWMFISQTMQGIDSEILMQLRSMFFGYGLSFGLEFRRLQQLAGGDDEAMNLYRSFRDPQSAMNPESKQFPFMAIGPVSPMPFAGQPMFFTAFNGADFLDANNWEPFREE